MNAIRIEDSYGFGWAKSMVSSCSTQWLMSLAQLPIPCCDGMSVEEEDFFAYPDFEALASYINVVDFDIMVENGFKVYELEVCPTCIKMSNSKHQMTFTLKGLLSKKDITNELRSKFIN